MKISKKALKIAKPLLKAAFIGGKINEGKGRGFLKILKKHPSKIGSEVVFSLQKLIEAETLKKQLVLETPFPLQAKTVDRLKNEFEALLNRQLTVEIRENKELIGGLRIKNSDNVWENTVESTLQQLKGALVR